MTILYALSWVIGGLLTLSTFSIVFRARLSAVGKSIISLVVGLVILLFVVPQQSALAVFLSLVLLNAAVRPLLMRSGAVAATLASLLASVAVIIAGNLFLEPESFEYTGNMVADVQTNVAKRWEKLVAECDHIANGYQRNLNPGAKPSVPKKEVLRQLERIRELLLPVDCHDLLAAVDSLDKRIAETQDEIVKAEGDRVRHPDEAEKYDARIATVKARKANLETERANQAAKVMENLRGIGLNIPGSAAERCIFTVNVESLIDIAIVAKDIATVVEHLGRFLDTEDLKTAKRYFGMYLVMIDVQMEGLRQYLDKSENGEWRKGINEILRAAESAVKSDTANAAQTRFTVHEREIFRRNAEINKKTIKAAWAYLDLLRQHEGVVRAKLQEAERVREVAQSSWNTVSLASDLKEIVKRRDFAAMLTLEFPPFVLFDDSALQAEFDAITRKLRKE